MIATILLNICEMRPGTHHGTLIRPTISLAYESFEWHEELPYMAMFYGEADRIDRMEI